MKLGGGTGGERWKSAGNDEEAVRQVIRDQVGGENRTFECVYRLCEQWHPIMQQSLQSESGESEPLLEGASIWLTTAPWSEFTPQLSATAAREKVLISRTRTGKIGPLTPKNRCVRKWSERKRMKSSPFYR
jgi:hypothetical protein